MDHYIKNILTEHVHSIMESANRIHEQKKQKYWYPLSLPTYGPEEVVEAIDSMANFRTTMWDKTALFEQNFTSFQASKGSVMVNSGSSADTECFDDFLRECK